MEINKSLKLYLGLVDVLKACINDVQVWPPYYIWTQQADISFSNPTDSKNGYSMDVAKTSNGKTRVVIGMPFSNSNYGRIRVFEFAVDLSSYTEMNFQTTTLARGNNNDTSRSHYFGFSVAFSQNGLYLAVGAPCNSDVRDDAGWKPGFARVFTCWEANTTWEKSGIFLNTAGLQDDSNGYILSPNNPGQGFYNFGFSVAIDNNGTLYASEPRATTAGGSGAIYAMTVNSITNRWALYKTIRVGNITYGDGRVGKCIKLGANVLVATTQEGNMPTFLEAFTAVWNLNTGTASDDYSPVIIWPNGSRVNDNRFYGTDYLGLDQSAISISGNNQYLAIGHPRYTESLKKGRVKVYQLNKTSGKITSVTQIGQTIEGTFTGHQLGFSVSLNHNGDILAIASRGDKSITIYKLVGVTWTQYSQNFFGENNTHGQALKFTTNSTAAEELELFYTDPLRLVNNAQKGSLTIQKFPAGSQIYPNL